MGASSTKLCPGERSPILRPEIEARWRALIDEREDDSATLRSLAGDLLGLWKMEAELAEARLQRAEMAAALQRDRIKAVIVFLTAIYVLLLYNVAPNVTP